MIIKQISHSRESGNTYRGKDVKGPISYAGIPPLRNRLILWLVFPEKHVPHTKEIDVTGGRSWLDQHEHVTSLRPEVLNSGFKYFLAGQLVQAVG